MLQSNQSNDFLGPIQIRPHAAVLWPVEVRSENEQKSLLELQSQKVKFFYCYALKNHWTT